MHQVACAAALDALVSHVEHCFGKRVYAVQINVHIDSSAHHVQVHVYL